MICAGFLLLIIWLGADFSANADFKLPVKRAANTYASPLGLKFLRNNPGEFSAAFTAFESINCELVELCTSASNFSGDCSIALITPALEKFNLSKSAATTSLLLK